MGKIYSIRSKNQLVFYVSVKQYFNNLFQNHLFIFGKDSDNYEWKIVRASVIVNVVFFGFLAVLNPFQFTDSAKVFEFFANVRIGGKKFDDFLAFLHAKKFFGFVNELRKFDYGSHFEVITRSQTVAVTPVFNKKLVIRLLNLINQLFFISVYLRFFLKNSSDRSQASLADSAS